LNFSNSQSGVTFAQPWRYDDANKAAVPAGAVVVVS
jgi:hypothetical protein